MTGKDNPMQYHSAILRTHIEELLRSPDVHHRDDELSGLLDAYIAASRRELERPEGTDPEWQLTFDKSMALTAEREIDALDLLTHLCKPEAPSTPPGSNMLSRQMR